MAYTSNIEALFQSGQLNGLARTAQFIPDEYWRSASGFRTLCRGGHTKLVQAVFRRRPPEQNVAHQGLLEAVRSNHPELASFLVEFGAYSTPFSVLGTVIRRSNSHMMRQLLHVMPEDVLESVFGPPRPAELDGILAYATEYVDSVTMGLLLDFAQLDSDSFYDLLWELAQRSDKSSFSNGAMRQLFQRWRGSLSPEEARAKTLQLFEEAVKSQNTAMVRQLIQNGLGPSDAAQVLQDLRQDSLSDKVRYVLLDDHLARWLEQANALPSDE